jgi:hypothetical protein
MQFLIKPHIMNYTKLMSHNPTKYGSFINSIGQTIDFYEHPLRGDESPVLCVCHELQLASYSDFWELDDMTAGHREYEPKFIDSELRYGNL